MSWSLQFISEEDLNTHVRATIDNYGKKLEPYDIKKFNRNMIDPIKMLFDKNVYQQTWEEMIDNEIFRQRDKANNNDIGYFHQRIFQYMPHCHVPKNGKEGGWDIIYKNPEGICLPDGDRVHTVYVEMKNKHNTMNSSSEGKTYIKMQNQLLSDDDCACFLVEIIAKKSQNIKWETTVDAQKVSHKRIRRVSIDQFYALVTGQEDAFYQLCMELPRVLQNVMRTEASNKVPHDVVAEELKKLAMLSNEKSQDQAMALAVYMLGFSSYQGFATLMGINPDNNESMLKRLYTYAKEVNQG